MSDDPSTPTRRNWQRRLPTVIEVSLAIILAFSLGRLTVDTSSDRAPGAVDIGFSQDMAVHHEQAVEMADLAQSHGSPTVASLAKAILINQSQEIGLLRGWLGLWHKPATDPTPMSWLPAMSQQPGGSMPGMATPDQLTRLASLTGRRFDVLFLQLMIRHHQGGLEMCEYANDHATLRIVRDAARSMAVEQVEDLGQLQAILKADGGTGS